ncbi:fasciclin domain-containing protein [Pedobacter nyackensis]|uniref:fasciclin domain-containing protein n=1 Tax=Pedobacter nyackensis TaxID=475255 RepID=UPI0029318E0F|nr:fasciclin domain-containing protein [Pedobacter nyackensis]
MKISGIKKYLFLIGMATISLIACRKDSGYYDHKPISQRVQVNVYDYLKSKKGIYDSMILVVDRLGLKPTLMDSNITVFAVTNSSFRLAVANLNNTRKLAGRGPVNLSNMDYIQLDTIMTQYIMRGQYSTEELANQDGVVLRGVRFGYKMNAKLNTVATSGFQHGGPKVISYSDMKWSQFSRNWTTTTTSSTNLFAVNGVIHTIDQDHVTGFRDFVIRFTITFPPINYIKLYRGIFTVSAEGGGGPRGQEGSYFMIDENRLTKFLNRNALVTKPFWMNVEFPESQVCNSYAFTSANDVPGRNPKAWNLQGSDDMINWEILDERSGQNFEDFFLQKIYRFENTKAYKHYRMNITQNNGSGNELQIAEYILGFK